MPLTDQFNNTPPSPITPARAAAFDNTAPAFSAPGRGAAFSNTAPAFSAPGRGAAFDNTKADLAPTGTENFTARAQTTASVTISTLIVGAVIDGVTLAEGDLVLAANQSSASQNGLYRITAGGAAPVRATSHGFAFAVRVGPAGTANKGKAFAYFPILPYTVDTTAVNFTALVAQPH
jgi:hypothetical protein